MNSLVHTHGDGLVPLILGAAEGVADFIGSGFYKGVQGISSLGGLAPNPVSEWAGRNADAFFR